MLVFMATFANSTPIRADNGDDVVSYVVDINAPAVAEVEKNVPALETSPPEFSEVVYNFKFIEEKTAKVSAKLYNQSAPAKIRRLCWQESI